MNAEMGLGETRIVGVEKDLLLCDAISRLVREAMEGPCIELFTTGAASLLSLRAKPANLAIVGLDLPDIDGLDLLRILAEERLATRLLVASCRQDENTRLVLRQLHINGFFDPVTEPPEAFQTAIRQVLSGMRYVSPTWREEQLRHSSVGKPLIHEVLSTTEFQVFAMIGDGSTDEDAASTLGISAKTVHSHRQRIMRKLGLQSRAGIMREAIARGVVRYHGDKVVRPGFAQDLLLRRRRLGLDGEPESIHLDRCGAGKATVVVTSGGRAARAR